MGLVSYRPPRVRAPSGTFRALCTSRAPLDPRQVTDVHAYSLVSRVRFVALCYKLYVNFCPAFDVQG